MSDIKNPVFDDGKSTAIVSNIEQTFNDINEYDGPKINILVLSFNRPRMLNEALYSIFMQGYYNIKIWVIDDGSEFDVGGLVDNFVGNTVFDVELRLHEKMDQEERVKRSRLSNNINNVLDSIPRGEYVTYLCDDDIMPPNWLRRAAIALAGNPDYHVINGELYWFHDGEDWMVNHEYGIPGFDGTQTQWYSTGSVIHMSDCYLDEGLRWYDNEYGHSQDINFLNDLFEMHKDHLVAAIPANVRREHDNTLSNKLGRIKDGKYITGFIPGNITKDMISGMME